MPAPVPAVVLYYNFQDVVLKDLKCFLYFYILCCFNVFFV